MLVNSCHINITLTVSMISLAHSGVQLHKRAISKPVCLNVVAITISKEQWVNENIFKHKSNGYTKFTYKKKKQFTFEEETKFL
jgi:hypothetical protein